MKNRHLDIIPIGDIDDRVLHMLSAAVHRCFGFPCRINEPWEVPFYAYNPDRKQYYSTLILKELCRRVKKDSIRTIGIISLDLYIPIFTFVFGEAQLESHCAIISLSRLRQEFYGLKQDDKLFMSRVAKEAIHELTHTFGLTHCYDVNCVMHASYSIGDTDIKSDRLCRFCNHTLLLKLEALKKIL